MAATDELFDAINIDNNKLDADLIAMLKENHLYDDLYSILNDYTLTLGVLTQLKTSELADLCRRLNLTIIQTLKFRDLMKLIDKSTMGNRGVDIDLEHFLDTHKLSDLYHIFQREGIGFDELETITPHDIDHLCDDNDVKIGSKINLKNAIDQHQIEILKTRYSTPGNPIYAEREEQKDEGPYDAHMKVVLLGDSAVGKTCLLKRYIFSTYDINEISTVGVDYGVARQRLSNGKIMKMNIWDTAGQERFHSISRAYYRDADAIIVCYAVNNRLSFTNVSKWRDDIDDYAQTDGVVVMLVGCKADMKMKKPHGKGNTRKVTLHDVREMACSDEWKKFSTQWGECSARTGDNIESIFITVAELVMQQRKKQSTTSRTKIHTSDNQINQTLLQKEGAGESSSCFDSCAGKIRTVL
eukprot:302902_1